MAIFEKGIILLRKPHPAIVVLIALVSVGLLWYTFAKKDSTPLEDQSIYYGTVVEVLSEEEVSEGISRGSIEQQLIVAVELPHGVEEKPVLNDYTPVSAGDRLYIKGSFIGEVEEDFYTIGVVRQSGLLLLGILFAGLTIAVGRYKGLGALVGLLFSLAVIFSFVVPRILAGSNPIFIGLVGATLILVISLYIAHGFNRVSIPALIGLVLTLVIVGLMTHYFIGTLHFTGFAADEALYLNSATGAQLDLTGLLIAGIIIAAIGVLDDIAVTQASTVRQLALSNPLLTRRELYVKAMDIGRDHIAAVINTLVLAYVGAALPLILLLTVNNFDPLFVVNGEVVAEEIARTLLSSFGLILAVPITTWLAAAFASHTTESEGGIE